MDIFIQMAITEAKKSTMEFKHGCVCIDPKTGVVLGRGFNEWDLVRYRFDNQVKRSEKQNKIYGVHAEARAIFRVPRSYRLGMTIVVVRINANGRICNSKPCAHCTRLINKYQITVYYST
jgi:deoxycytidylate deaminase